MLCHAFETRIRSAGVAMLITLVVVEEGGATIDVPARRRVEERELRPCTLVPNEGGVASLYQTNLWWNGEVYYTFDPTVSEANKQLFLAAINELEGVCGVVFLS